MPAVPVVRGGEGGLLFQYEPRFFMRLSSSGA